MPKLSEVPTNRRALSAGGGTPVTAVVESDALKQRQADELSFWPLWPGLVSVIVPPRGTKAEQN